MKIFILAAGLGTRLKKLTENTPKALVLFNNKPLLEHLILKFKHEGFNDFVINVHHFADQIEDFLIKNNNFGVQIQISDERAELLDTGGALLHAEHLLKDSENILIHNVDIVSDINIKKMLQFHKTQKALATLAVQNRDSSRKLFFDDKNMLCQWKNLKTGEQKIARHSNDSLKEYAFSGIHIVNRKIFDFITETGKFSIIDLYLRLAEKNYIAAYDTIPKFWFDLGKPETILKAEKALKNMQL